MLCLSNTVEEKVPKGKVDGCVTRTLSRYLPVTPTLSVAPRTLKALPTMAPHMESPMEHASSTTKVYVCWRYFIKYSKRKPVFAGQPGPQSPPSSPRLGPQGAVATDFCGEHPLGDGLVWCPAHCMVRACWKPCFFSPAHQAPLCLCFNLGPE